MQWQVWTSLRLDQDHDLVASVDDRPCHIGSKVSVRCGGDFFYDGSGQDCSGDLLLVAGGVGITPIASIARHAVDLQEKLKKQNKRSSSKKVVLLYSAVETGEFLFENHFRSLSVKNSYFQVFFYITGQERYSTSVPQGYQFGRINSHVLHEKIQSLDRRRLLCYVCGPPPMSESVCKMLEHTGIDESQILYEKWW
ncbi:oxidoreductase NAD-binding domain-containing protein 1-like [Corticium candelabrum]|uniref:oxidoreductase NAD-binding domain-containing protein 1-like n=1 Tax=Corticium candelabrum TaxID=121492 RepID=UPI002E263EEF|nr:oxidoreductase NAD-binding domain-containing protein 1-like [Corticium candelabrum]